MAWSCPSSLRYAEVNQPRVNGKKICLSLEKKEVILISAKNLSKVECV
ncbi:MAG: hypothetical protein JW804_03695 [Sedimentisphaerales bacterium]|nr:hypothetical protein [Sedimentisphaerales bacterium]